MVGIMDVLFSHSFHLGIDTFQRVDAYALFMSFAIENAFFYKFRSFILI